MTLLWDPIKLAKAKEGIQVIPSNQRRRYVERLVKALDKGAIGIGELLQVAQYDLTTKKLQRSLAAATRRIANALGFRDKNRLRNETSSTYLFSTATYYVLRDLLERYGLVFAIEPRILSTYTVTYDYAIIDVSKTKIIILVEVKRLQKLGNIDDYINAFREKVRRITYLIKFANSIDHVALQLHVTPELCEKYRGIERLLAGIGLLLTEARQPMLIISTSICRDKDSAESFQKQLIDQISAIVS